MTTVILIIAIEGFGITSQPVDTMAECQALAQQAQSVKAGVRAVCIGAGNDH